VPPDSAEYLEQKSGFLHSCIRQDEEPVNARSLYQLPAQQVVSSESTISSKKIVFIMLTRPNIRQ